jgi:hypothetical protein
MVVSVPDNPAMPAMMTGLWYAVRFGHFLILGVQYLIITRARMKNDT